MSVLEYWDIKRGSIDPFIVSLEEEEMGRLASHYITYPDNLLKMPGSEAYIWDPEWTQNGKLIRTGM